MNEPEMMFAALSSEYGNHQKITVEQRPVPVAGDNDVLVKVAYASVSAADTMMRAGTPKFGRLFLGLFRPKNPYLGTGFSGKVVSCGKGVSQFKVGDEVFGETGVNFGANAEYVCIDSNEVICKKPEHIPSNEAASLCDGVLTSYNFLSALGKVKPGQKVLINGGAGALGSAAVQLAKNLGCIVYATCSRKNNEFLKSLGADHTIDYGSGELSQKVDYFDVIYDTVGKLPYKKARLYLKKEGTYLTPVLSLDVLCSMITQKINLKKHKVVFSATGLLNANVLKEYLNRLLKIAENKGFHVHVEKEFPISSVAEAHKLIDEGHKRGNYVIKF